MAFTVMSLGNEVRVNATGLDDQEEPAITALADGRWVVTWDGFGPQGRGVYQQLFSRDVATGEITPVFTNSSGQPMERRVNTFAPTGSEAKNSSVEAFGDGWIVTWTQSVSGSREDIFVQRFDAEGRPMLTVDGQPADIRVNQTVAERQEDSQITVLPDGWLVTWVDVYRKGVYQQRFDADGQALYRENGQPVDRRVSAITGTNNVVGQDVAAINGGNVVVWQKQSNAGDPYDLVMQIMDSNGNPTLANDVLIAPSAAGSLTPPRVEVLPGGDEFIVVWTAADSNQTGIYLQKFNVRGEAQFAAPLQVNTIEAGAQSDASIEILDDGGWVVTFSSGLDVYQRIYDENGNPRGPESQIWAKWLGSQWNQGAEATALGNGQWVTAWTTWNQGADDGMGVSQRITTLSALPVLTAGDEFAFGTNDAETLDVRANGLSDHDRIDGGGGDDTLRMIEAGTLDLLAPNQFTGIETIVGSGGNDTIIANAGRFAGIKSISGEGGTDELHLVDGGEYDLRNVTISGIDQIVLKDFVTTLQVGDKSTGLLVHGEGNTDTLIFREGTFNLAERYQLFRQGIEKVTDASGTYNKTAEAILYLNGDEVFGQAGAQVRLDAGQDAEVSATPPFYSTLRAVISTNRVNSQDQLKLLETDRIDISGTAVVVDGQTVGQIADDGSGPNGFMLSLNAAATPDRVQALVRALAYENTATNGLVTDPRKVTITLEDAGGVPSAVEVDVRFTVTNTAPQVIVRDTTPVRGADTSLLSPFANVWIRDSDSPSVTVTIQFDPSAGKLVLGPQSLGSYDPAEGTYIVTAHPEMVSDDLKRLQFDPVDRSEPIGSAVTIPFTIRVSDGNAADEDTVSVVSVTANRSPTQPLLSASTVKELAADGTAIGTVSGSDPNEGDSVSYSLVGAEDAPFRLVTQNGVTQLVVTNGTKIDYEQKQSYTFTLRATDAAGLSNDRVVTIAVEDVNPENTAGSSLNDVIVGGAGRDTLGGGSGNDTLFGGLGTDVLTGNAGKDVFVFNTKANRKTNVDTIKDFVVKDDTIWLDNAVFTKIGKGSEASPGKLTKGFFVVATKAKDKNDYVIYDKKTGALYYDADGTGKAAQVKIATLKKNLAMTEKDFFVI